MCFFSLKLWLNEQRHGSIPGDSQNPMLFSDNLTGTRRSSTSFLDTLRRRTNLQNLLEQQASSKDEMDQLLLSTSAFIGSSSFTNDDQAPNNVSEDTGAEYSSEQVKMNSQAQSMSFSRRNSDVHPHYCQACMAMLLAVRSGGRGSLGHASSPSSSPIHQNIPPLSLLKPSFPPDLAHPDSSSPIYMTPQSPYISTLPPKQVSVTKNIHISSIPVQVTPPSPVHKSHSPSQIPVTDLPKNMSSLSHTTAFTPVYVSIPSPVHTSSRHMSISSPVDPPSPLRSSSPVSPITGPHSPSLRDSSDLSHLHRCLHHIINRRTSSPVLMDRVQAGDRYSDASVRFLVPQVQSVGSLYVPLSHQETGSFSVQDSEVGSGLVVGEK
ncbi:uncharacterized protein LOC131549732 [Onychostoma macrolepis]|uniref:uncharacterized protein LOC131549732 n=1 Tax=Onychostoma macrolepis TaxID=369639 RepID=UPI00272B140E|nr:uncharacterized protein LOC131549732 [Onychostoma macrolepis]